MSSSCRIKPRFSHIGRYRSRCARITWKPRRSISAETSFSSMSGMPPTGEVRIGSPVPIASIRVIGTPS